jgi:nicotinamide mononucleotide transporter
LTIDPIELAGFATGVANVWLLARQHIWNWPVALANNALYLAVFFSAGLYGDAALQLVYAGFGIYGWWSWSRAAQTSAPLSVQSLPRPARLRVAAITCAAFVLISFFLKRFTDSTVPAADGLTTALALAATWGQSRKYVESWWLWIAADVIYIPLYGYKQLWLTAALYVIFLGLCIGGLRAWNSQLATSVRTGSATQSTHSA